MTNEGFLICCSQPFGSVTSATAAKVGAVAPGYGHSVRSFLFRGNAGAPDETPSGGSLISLHRDQLQRNGNGYNNVFPDVRHVDASGIRPGIIS
jgi:hypothetical protein